MREKRLALEDALRLFTKVCGAIQYAHQRGIIHRDLKPTNILVDAAGEPKVLDFGLAKWLAAPAGSVSMSQQVMGTLPYMSPEQARGNPDEIDTRTDIYALGRAGDAIQRCRRLPRFRPQRPRRSNTDRVRSRRWTKMPPARRW